MCIIRHIISPVKHTKEARDIYPAPENHAIPAVVAACGERPRPIGPGKCPPRASVALRASGEPYEPVSACLIRLAESATLAALARACLVRSISYASERLSR